MVKQKSVAIQVKDVEKRFLLPHEKNSSIKSSIVGVFKKKNKGAEVQKALRGLSFEVKEGEFFGILGRNGSGKSTLLKILAEIYQPSSGSVDITGKLVPFIELGVGFNPELTGRENVYLNGALLGFSKKEIDERYDDIVEFAELENFMDQKLKNYSSGMQVRLAFSVATRAEADILLVDEVLAVGDADFQRKCYDFFKSLKKSGKTIVFVTHDMNAVREYCDKAILINNGKITHSGKAETVADEYLKLFYSHEESTAVKGSKSGIGTGQVVFTKMQAKVEDGDARINLSLEGKDEDVDIVVGLRIKDAEGRLIGGANTKMLLSNERITIKAGEAISLDYTIPVSYFGAGTKYVGASIKLSDGVTICDDWDNTTKFSVTSDQSFYPIVLPLGLTVKRDA